MGHQVCVGGGPLLYGAPGVCVCGWAALRAARCARWGLLYGALGVCVWGGLLNESPGVRGLTSWAVGRWGGWPLLYCHQVCGGCLPAHLVGRLAADLSTSGSLHYLWGLGKTVP